MGRERGFAPFRRPSQLAPRSAFNLSPQHRLPGMADRIPGAQPHEVEQLMNQNPRKFGARAIEADSTLAQEAAGMHRTAPVAEAAREFNVDGTAAKSRNTAKSGANPPQIFRTAYEFDYSRVSAWCRTSMPFTRNSTSSAIFVAWSAMRSRFCAMNISDTLRWIVVRSSCMNSSSSS